MFNAWGGFSGGLFSQRVFATGTGTQKSKSVCSAGLGKVILSAVQLSALYVPALCRVRRRAAK